MTNAMDYEVDFEEQCPNCKHSPIHYRNCTNILCEDGAMDVSEDDYLEPGTIFITCNECRGTGIEKWCPNCGKDLNNIIK